VAVGASTTAVGRRQREEQRREGHLEASGDPTSTTSSTQHSVIYICSLQLGPSCSLQWNLIFFFTIKCFGSHLISVVKVHTKRFVAIFQYFVLLII